MSRSHGTIVSDSTQVKNRLKGLFGPLRAAVILAFTITPHRFRTKSQFWKYCGLAVTSKITGEYVIVDGRAARSRKKPLVRGLNINYNHTLKEAFKGAAATAAIGTWKPHYDTLAASGTRPSLALWKKGELYDSNKMKTLHAV